MNTGTIFPYWTATMSHPTIDCPIALPSLHATPTFPARSQVERVTGDEPQNERMARDMTFLSETLGRLEARNLTRKRRISQHAWNHAIQVLTERIQELDRQAAEATGRVEASRSAEEHRAAQHERNVAVWLRSRLLTAKERIQELTNGLKEVGKGPERKSLADPYIRQIRAARAAETEAEQRWRSAMAKTTSSASSGTAAAAT